MNPTMLRVSDVWKSFGQESVLRGISVDVTEHEVVVLIGASGSGKSTLLRCINGLETVDAGSIILDNDLDVTAFRTDLDAVRRRVGIVFQSYNLFPHMTVLKNITLGQRKGQAVRLVSRCLWDAETDNCASASWSNARVYAVAMCFALYYE